MAPRSVTRDDESVAIPGGRIDFKTPAGAPSRATTVTFNTGHDIPRTGLHWHETHTEYLQVLQGHALITVGDRTAVFTKDDGVITIPRFTIHGFGRADHTEEGKGSRDIELIMREWTDPADGDKELFFRNLMGLVKDWKKTLLGNISMGISALMVSRGHDSYPVFWHGPTLFGKGVQVVVMRGTTYTVLRFVAIVGWLGGYRAEYEEYTPK
jgi:mannose-6-phosphate isomerase-like protein (cupin superfamily)